MARVSQGEMLGAICADPLTPSLRTVMRGARTIPTSPTTCARRGRGWPSGWATWAGRWPWGRRRETAYLTQVQLGQLRWTAAVLGPRTHGPDEARWAAPGAWEVQTIRFRHFEIEVNAATGQHRVVGWTPDPDAQLPVRTS